MNSFINVKKDFNPKENFWDLNPHLIYVKPFSIPYNEDRSSNKEESSKDMWCILWMSDPDEDVNKYYRLPYNERLDVCKEFNKEFNEEKEIIKDCINAYPEKCLSTIERAYKMEKDQLAKRAEFLAEADYNFETMKSLDHAKGITYKIYKDFERIEKEYFASKKSENRILGGRRASPREKGIIRPSE